MHNKYHTGQQNDEIYRSTLYFLIKEVYFTVNLSFMRIRYGDFINFKFRRPCGDGERYLNHFKVVHFICLVEFPQRHNTQS